MMIPDQDKHCVYWLEDVRFVCDSTGEGTIISLTLLGVDFPPGNEHGCTIKGKGETLNRKDLPVKGGYFLIPSERCEFEALSKKTLDELLTDDCPLIRAITSVIAKQGTNDYVEQYSRGSRQRPSRYDVAEV
jgi:hypothetical protein